MSEASAVATTPDNAAEGKASGSSPQATPSPASTTSKSKPPKTAAGVFVALPAKRRRELLEQMETDADVLGLSKSAMLLAIYEDYRSAGRVTGLAEVRQAEADEAAALRTALQPLVDAVEALTAANNARAKQRQAIGVHSNQVAKYVNTVMVGGTPEHVDVGGVLAGVKSLLEEQAAAERTDDHLRHQLQSLARRAGGGDG